MNPLLERLQPYPFERLRELLVGADPPRDRSAIALQIGEPRHAPPPAALEALTRALPTLGSYPSTQGLPELRAAIAAWLERRFGLAPGGVSPESMVLPVAGTREGLFSFVQAVVDPGAARSVAMPNPFYQIYEGAALLAGAEPVYLNADAAAGHLPDLDAVAARDWNRCSVLFLCSPANPSGAVMPLDYLRHAVSLAARHGFTIASDECYSEIYQDEARPPAGILAAARAAGHDSYQHCVAFHSLSKRSSLPGLRSGFVAGDPLLLRGYARYRTYHGCALPLHTQLASIAAWSDEAHVVENRALYRAKFDAVLAVLADTLPLERPAGAFYLWFEVGDDRAFARRLFETQHVTVLPGSFLARPTAQGNPGAGRVRVSLVAGLDDCVEAARRLRACLRSSADQARRPAAP